MALKPTTFHGDALNRIRDFPDDVRRQVGHELYQLQKGEYPNDSKPLSVVGAGVREIRIREAFGAYRVIYIAGLGSAIHVLQCAARV
jgi:phage-related protein